MERIHDELEEVKVEAEKLREECRAKTELYHSLRKAQVEQLDKSRQDKLEIHKLAQELNAKSDEICEIRKMCEELQSSLHRKDLFLKQISSANEKLRVEYGEKISKLEGENRDLVLSLDEASARIYDLEEKTRLSCNEIAGLKRLLAIKTERCSEEVNKSVSKDLKQRDEYILKLEEENRVFQDQLKWKNEHFSHLEEAHSQLRTQFQTSKMEWQKEKSSLVDEISVLQANLDAQVRVSENLETQLRLSNQALAHEESRRKVLEIELSESRAQFENVVLDCQVAKSEIEQLTFKRDEDIAELRMLLRKNEIVANEIKYKIAQLEQENSDLLASLKDIQEAQINYNATSSSLKKLQNKLEGLEKLHNKCGVNLKEKAAEWDRQRDKLTGEMKTCVSELDCKNKIIRELHNELEDCQCLLEVKNEESFALIMVLKSEFYVAYSNLYEAKERLNIGIMQIEEKNMLLHQKLQTKNIELHKVHAELKQKCDEIAVLMEQVESLNSLKQKTNLLEEELRKHKAMLDESNECKKQLLELEYSNRESVENALETVNLELANRTSEVEKLKLELLKSESEVEILKLNSGENQKAHKQESESFLLIVKDKDAEIGKLLEKIRGLEESVILAKSEAVEMLNQEKDNYIRLAEDRNCMIESLEKKIGQLKNTLAEQEAANVALLDSLNILEQENKRFLSDIEEKDQKMQELQKEFASLIEEKKVVFDEALKAAEGQKNLAIEEKNQIIINLEKEVNSLRNEVEFQEKSSIETKQMVLQLENLVQTKESEMQEVKNQLGELESDKQALLEEFKKASVNRENVIAQFEGICGHIGIMCREDVELMGLLGKMLPISDENGEHKGTTFSPSRKSIQATLDERAPLTELNY